MVNPGAPMRVRFEVSDDAFVTVVRVDDNGRMTILFPYARNQRAAARGGMIHRVRNPRLGDVSFFATDRMGGYVFALASYAPLDFTGFENRDYERLGGYSAFTQVNRNIASRPDVFIDRFAAAVLWDRDTPYDYDVDYYTPSVAVGALNSYSMCGSMFNSYRANSPYSMLPSWAPGWMWSDWDLMSYPYGSMCRSWYNNLRCFSYLSLYSYTACNPVVVANPTQPGPQPVDSAETVIPNEGVVRGGMAAPSPVPVLPGDADPPPQERPARSGPTPRFAEGNDWEKIMSIPARATRRMKEEDVRREGGSLEGSFPVRTARERPEVTGKRENPRTMDASTRSNTPQREPTRVRETRDRGRDDDTRATTRGGGSYTPPSTGSGTSAPRPTTSDRPNRPVETKPPATSGSAPNPPAVKPATTTTTTTEPKKPPQKQR